MKLKNFIRFDNSYMNPYIIAEAGVNHEGSMQNAKLMIEQAKEAGVNAIKFQSYKADTLAVKDSPAYWDITKEKSKTQYELFKKYDSFGVIEFTALKEYCDKVGIEFLSTPFDIDSANYLNELMSVFKISSSDITNKPFIEHIARFGKPIILSTGASNIREVIEAVRWIEDCGNEDIVLLHCILSYPTKVENANLGSIEFLKHVFTGLKIGYSDHTVGIRACIDSVWLGAQIIEKHFTLDKSKKGNDHYHAADKTDLKILVNEVKRINTIYGKFNKECLDCEKDARLNARRSLVAKKEIKIGEKLSEDNLIWKRPGIGISPKEIDNVINKIVIKNIKKDELISYNNIVSKI